MEITVTGRKKDVPERFRRHLQEKLEKIPQLAPRVRRTEVVLTHEANPRLAAQSERCEITCYVHRTVVRAEAAADEEYAALDLAMTKVLERLRRLHDRRQVSHTGKHRHTSVAEATFGLPTEPLLTEVGAPAEAAMSPEERVDNELGTQGNSPIEIREKTHPSTPMTVGQALSHMELVGHDFFLFQDVESGGPAVVYRRRGWSYGVLRLDPEAAPTAEAATGSTEAQDAGGTQAAAS